MLMRFRGILYSFPYGKSRRHLIYEYAVRDQSPPVSSSAAGGIGREKADVLGLLTAVHPKFDLSDPFIHRAEADCALELQLYAKRKE